MSICIEAAELNELLLWKTVEECDDVDREKIGEELAEIFAFSFLLVHKQGFDVKEIVLDKIRKNGLKYPVEKSKNSATKYTDL